MSVPYLGKYCIGSINKDVWGDNKGKQKGQIRHNSSLSQYYVTAVSFVTSPSCDLFIPLLPF